MILLEDLKISHKSTQTLLLLQLLEPEKFIVNGVLDSVLTEPQLKNKFNLIMILEKLINLDLETKLNQEMKIEFSEHLLLEMIFPNQI